MRRAITYAPWLPAAGDAAHGQNESTALQICGLGCVSAGVPARRRHGRTLEVRGA